MPQKTVLIGINNLTQVDQLAYANHMQFFFNLGKKNPDVKFILCNPRRMSIDRMRNFCAAMVLEHHIDELMFIDDDVLLPEDSYQQLAKYTDSGEADIIAGVTLIRGYPFHPMIFDFKDKENHYMDDYASKIEENGLVNCDAVGFSICLMKTEILRKVTPPYFITGEKHTEDIYFCQKVTRQVPGAKIRVNPKVETGHILGSDIIAPDSILARRAYEEAVDPSLKEAHEKSKPNFETRIDHDEDYLKTIGIPLDA